MTDPFRLSKYLKIFKGEPINSAKSIFKGEQTSKITTPRPIAVKFIAYDVKKIPEADILLKLVSHPNVVSIIHSGVAKQGPVSHIYIAMELCHVQNLNRHVIENKNNNVPFDPKRSIRYAKQIVKGLDHIHSHKIIHRDLKPHNILFSLDKKTLKISDFGISKELTHGVSKTRVTNIGAGTDGYRAPETYNSDVISKRADVFSLGLVFYFLWSNGQHPFGNDPDMWNCNIKKNENRDLSQCQLPDKESADFLLQWMLQFTDTNRPTAAQVLSNSLLKKQEPLTPKPAAATDEPSSVEKMIEWTEKSKHYLELKNYQIAEGYLQQLFQLQKDPYQQSATLRQIAECHVMYDQPCADDIGKITSICRSLQLSPDDVKSTAASHLDDSNLIRAYIMYVCASAMYKTDSTPNDAVVGIRNCTCSMWTLVTQMTSQPRLRRIASSKVIPSMCDMLTDLRAIGDVSNDFKVENEVSCLANIGACHDALGDHEKALENHTKGVELMKTRFGENASKYQIVGVLLNNSGVAYDNLEQYAKAVLYYSDALDAKRKAINYSSPEEKQKCIKTTEKNLQTTRDKLDGIN